jgi:hypothetical protein
MRTAALTSFLLVAFGSAAIAQKLTLLPHVGFENSRTTISYNNLNSFAPLGGEFSPQVGLRLDYRFKQGFGPWLAISSSRSVVSYSFSDPEKGMNLFTAVSGDMQLRLEGGYQYSTKPIYFTSSKQSAARSRTYKQKSTGKDGSSYFSRSNCMKNYSATSNRCAGKSSTAKKAAVKTKGTWVKLQPSAGVGFIPSVKPDVITKTSGSQTTYEYRAGNWNTALITGMGFEFGRKNQRLFSISINYFNGIGNLSRQTITSTSGSKTTVTHLQSDASGWNVKLGIPFSIGLKKPVKKTTTEYKYRKPGCGQYKLEYKYRCRGIQ